MAKVFQEWATGLLLFAPSFVTYADDVLIEYQVPTGFSVAEQDNSMQFLSSLDGKPLPGPISWSAQENRLTFDATLYRQNGVSSEQIDLLNKVLSQTPYTVCPNGCEYTANGQKVSLDKIGQSLTITDGSRGYIQPQTNMGFLHNQSLDVRAATNRYRAVSAYGQGYLGLPAQSYGYLNWYFNDSKNYDTRTVDHGVSTWYLQKNFASTYLRSGRQDSRDSTVGNVSTSLNPSFDQFVTLGSQDNLKSDNQSNGKLILFAGADGDYEFYREGRLIRRLPAVIGRNEIDYNQFPAGFYSMDIRLVNDNGQVLSQEEQQISNLNYGGGTGWYLTLGKELRSGENILSAGANFHTDWFAASSALIKGADARWAMEHNLTRPMAVAQLEVTPTVGVIAGEKRTGSYASLSAGNQALGYLSASQYQNTSASEFYQARNSRSLSYGRQFGSARLSYNYSRYANSELQQLQSTWNWTGEGVWAVISAGVKKGGYNNSGNNYGMYLNTTIMLDHNTGTINTAYNNGKLHTGGSYTREFEDSTGTTFIGGDFSNVGRTNSLGINSRRSGTRGEASGRVGVNDRITSANFNYNGMFAASKDGFAFGQTSPSGVAMLVRTPDLGATKYGFKVENNPVSGNGIYAVPLAGYQDVAFARAQTVATNVDMNIRLPANVLRAHPGQVYPVKAEVQVSMLYNGFLIDNQGMPVSGILKETGDTAYPNGLFSIMSSTLLKDITVSGKRGRYRCDMTTPKDNRYLCVAD